MDHGDYVGLHLSWGDGAVGAFEPAKVVEQLLQAFPQAQIDPTDHQEVRLRNELAYWMENVHDESMRQGLIRTSCGCYQRNGPTIRFEIAFGDEYRISGWARRMSVAFFVPCDVPAGIREQLLAFLRSLRMGELVLEEDSLDDADEPSRSD